MRWIARKAHYVSGNEELSWGRSGTGNGKKNSLNSRRSNLDDAGLAQLVNALPLQVVELWFEEIGTETLNALRQKCSALRRLLELEDVVYIVSNQGQRVPWFTGANRCASARCVPPCDDLFW